MLSIEIDGKLYSLYFQHARRDGKRPELRRGPVRAVTVATLVVQHVGLIASIDFVATGVALCADGDQFARRVGRERAVARLLRNCGWLRDVREEIGRKYREADPAPPERAQRPKMAEEERERLRMEGLVKRETRRRAKMGAEAG